MFDPESVSTLDEPVSFTIAPAPETTPESVWSADEEYRNSVPLARLIAPAYEPEPSRPADAIFSSPAATVVAPAYVLDPVSDSVPESAFVMSAPTLPAMIPGYVSVVVASTSNVASLDPIAIPRFADNVNDAVVVSVPPFTTR